LVPLDLLGQLVPPDPLARRGQPVQSALLARKARLDQTATRTLWLSEQ